MRLIRTDEASSNALVRVRPVSYSDTAGVTLEAIPVHDQIW